MKVRVKKRLRESIRAARPELAPALLGPLMYCDSMMVHTKFWAGGRGRGAGGAEGRGSEVAKTVGVVVIMTILVISMMMMMMMMMMMILIKGLKLYRAGRLVVCGGSYRKDERGHHGLEREGLVHAAGKQLHPAEHVVGLVPLPCRFGQFCEHQDELFPRLFRICLNIVAPT